jgi:hypothetical protein
MTLGDFLDRVLDELNETSLTAQVMLATRSAIKHYDHEYMWFSEDRSFTVTTSAGQEFYGADDNARIPDLPGIESIILAQDATTRLTLERQSDAWFDAVSTNPGVTGQPSDYGYYGRQLRFYPIPDRAYVLTVVDHPKGTLTDSRSASSVWLEEAEELIRSRVKADIEINTIKIPEARAEAGALSSEGYLSVTEKIAHLRLVRESISRGTTSLDGYI